MMYPYMTLADGTQIVHSHLIEENGQKKYWSISKGLRTMGLMKQDVKFPHISG